MNLAFLLAGGTLLVGLGLGYVLGRRGGRKSSADGPEQPATPGRLPASPFPLGLLAGFASVALVGAVVFWLQPGGAAETVETTAPSAVMPAAEAPASSTPFPHEQQGALSPALAERDRYLTANPEDIEARRQMALLLLSEERHMDALGQADQILARAPGDPTALYVQGVVRLKMGQRSRGTELLEQALASDPRHVHSLIALATVHLQDGNQAEAVGVLERALEAAGGKHPGIEKKLAEARAAVAGSSAPPGSV
jgi:cytochrome c-type biogenesis protein CcmH/NrfG